MKQIKLFLFALALTIMPQAINAQTAANTQANVVEDLDAKYATNLLKPGTDAPDINLKTIDGKQFSLKSLRGKYVVLDFWATWCGPCRALGPVVSELAKEYDGKIVVGKCDVEANDDVTIEYRVRNIPTILFFKGGELVDKHVGAITEGDLRKKFDALL